MPTEGSSGPLPIIDGYAETSSQFLMIGVMKFLDAGPISNDSDSEEKASALV